jgi:hypothetical protein
MRGYIDLVCSSRLEFVNGIAEDGDTHLHRSVRASRILENFSVFVTCLNSFPHRKVWPADVINYLGYSSSSIVFLIKILLLTHESCSFSEDTTIIIDSINNF